LLVGKEKYRKTFFLGLLIAGLGIFLAAESRRTVFATLMQLSTVLAIVGMMICFLLPEGSSAKILLPGEPYSESKWHTTFKLWVWQIGLFFLTLCFLSLLQQQTILNARLQPLTPSLILQVIRGEFLYCALVPSILYTVVGLGLRYFSCTLQRSPVIAQAIFPRVRKNPQLFLKSFTFDIVDSVTRVPFLIITSFTLLWFCESVNALFGWEPMLQFPLRSTLIFSIMVFVLHKNNPRLIAWMDKQHIPVGKVLVFYVFAFSFFLIWLNATAKWFSVGQEMIDPNKALKSPLVGAFSKESLQIRLTLLFWGWGMVWIPWMASVVARYSIGLPLRIALLRALMVPLLIYFMIYPFVQVEYWLVFCNLIQELPIRFLILIGLLVFMWQGWGHLRNTAEIARGVMLPIGYLQALPLTRWMKAFSFWLMCHLIAWIMLGWVPTQITVTLGGVFMILVIVFFLFALASSLYRGEAVEKYRVQEPL
jgi:hypothetical protein